MNFNGPPVVAALRAAGVDTLMLKGVPLLFTYYRNHALRPLRRLIMKVLR